MKTWCKTISFLRNDEWKAVAKWISGSVGELSKVHHHELVTTIELDGVTVTFVAVDTLLERVFVDERQ